MNKEKIKSVLNGTFSGIKFFTALIQFGVMMLFTVISAVLIYQEGGGIFSIIVHSIFFILMVIINFEYIDSFKRIPLEKKVMEMVKDIIETKEQQKNEN